MFRSHDAAPWRARADRQDWFKLEFSGGPRQPRIVTATHKDLDLCSDIITLAFANDPAARWMYPDPHQYLRCFPKFVRAFGGGAIEQGSANVLNDCAAALWLPPGTGPDEPALSDLIEQSIDASRRDAVIALFQQMDEYHPETPHWHLSIIGVDPCRQRHGYGSALLRAMLRPCDEERTPAYLEATSPENVSLYERHGFVVVGVIQSHDSPPIFPMRREPR
jgi:ribosomal protein S18 acetylase RimI-like enzyme